MMMISWLYGYPVSLSSVSMARFQGPSSGGAPSARHGAIQSLDRGKDGGKANAIHTI